VPWREAVEHRELTTEYSATATFTFGECLAYLAASSDMEGSVKLLKGRRWLLVQPEGLRGYSAYA